MKKLHPVLILLFLFSSGLSRLAAQTSDQSHIRTGQRINPPIYIAFLWHMHQPIYWPYESVVQTDQNARYSYSVTDIHNQRWGPYTTWPKDAVQSGISAGLQHLGAQVSFSGSLIENLNNLESAGNGNFQNWKSSWNSIKNQSTVLGHPRIDMVGFGYHHPLMGLIDYPDIRKQIQAHKQILAANFSGSYSHGIFPPENAFSPREIPAMVDEGLQWVLVDNVHFDRACTGYPYSTTGNIVEPNKADIRNPNPGDWIQLNGLWAPTQNSARWGRQPHYVRYIDPSTGASSKMIAVPCDRYLGNEDGRGGYGALNYENVMSQLEPSNTDPGHPILIVLHHDGDNYGGGTDSYYHSNFQSFVNWLLANPTRFVCTTVEDYLQMFPPDTADVIHIEDGSWSGADNGDPEFKKWNGDPYNGYSPDRNSWGVITAAKNYVLTADQINPSASATQNAWHYFLNGEASDYWYWDGSQNGIWDAHPARASNLAIPYAQTVITGGTDLTPPTIYLPQREPYNPGGTEWGINQSNNFTVWTYAYDVSGLKSVTLKFRTSTNSTVQNANETFAGGSGITAWSDIAMTGSSNPSQTNPAPIVKAKEYTAAISGLNNILTDYYVEAVDSNNNVGRSPIMHVWVGPNSGGGGGTTGVTWTPTAPTADSLIMIVVSGATQGANLHWGVNNTGSSWLQANNVYWPAGTTLFGGTGPAVESPMSGPDTVGTLRISLGPFNNPAQIIERLAFVVHYNNNTWDNNSGQDYHITISGSSPPPGFVMDGSVDTSAQLVASNSGIDLYVGWNGTDLYVASQSALSQAGDMFILLSDSLKPMRGSMWAKGGSVSPWKAFLGNESTNNWSGWFNSTEGALAGSVQSIAGSYLEGTISLVSNFGKVPPVIYIAVGKYQTADAGMLLAQVPAGDGNGNIDSTEFFGYEYLSNVTPPPAPVLISPVDLATDQPVTITLRWNPSPTATGYHLQVSTDTGFTAGLVLEDTTGTSTSRIVSGLDHSTAYYWRVSAKNSGGSSPFSAARMFMTIIAPPPAPEVIAPADSSTGLFHPVTFLWHSSPTAGFYKIQIAPDAAFATVIWTDSMITDTASVCPVIYGKYYWRVSAINAGGDGPWSLVRSLTIDVPLPATPLLRLPANGAVDQPRVVRVEWDSVVWAATYHFQIATDSSFISPALDDSVVTIPATVIGPLQKNSLYYWRIRAVNATGRSNWSEIRHFTTGIDSTFQYPVGAGWNMVSIPVIVADHSRSALFPSAISSAFSYSGGVYHQTDTLQTGTGYWIKYPSASMLLRSGTPMMSDTLPVVTGWNLIGSVAEPLATSAVRESPGGIRSSNFFGYDGKYRMVDTLVPGRAYWVKFTQAGFLMINAPVNSRFETGDGTRNTTGRREK